MGLDSLPLVHSSSDETIEEIMGIEQPETAEQGSGSPLEESSGDRVIDTLFSRDVIDSLRRLGVVLKDRLDFFSKNSERDEGSTEYDTNADFNSEQPPD